MSVNGNLCGKVFIHICRFKAGSLLSSYVYRTLIWLRRTFIYSTEGGSCTATCILTLMQSRSCSLVLKFDREHMWPTMKTWSGWSRQIRPSVCPAQCWYSSALAVLLQQWRGVVQTGSLHSGAECKTKGEVKTFNDSTFTR